MSDTFSEEDLEPSADERAREIRDAIDRGAACAGALAAAVVCGGMVAMGVAAASIFAHLPPQIAGQPMSAAFGNFDKVAIAASSLALGAEVVRTFLTRAQRPRVSARIRRLCGIVLAGATAFMAMQITPTIRELNLQGVVRGEGELGERLAAVHGQAHLVAGLEILLGAAILVLHILTVPGARGEDDEYAAAPLPPGPRD